MSEENGDESSNCLKNIRNIGGDKRAISRRAYLGMVGGAAVAAIAGGAAYWLYTQGSGPPPSYTVTEAELIAAGYKNFEKATKPVAEPQDWITPPAAYQDKEEIVLGGSMPLTGVFSWAVSWEKIRRKWEERINASGGLLGLPVRLLIYDDGSDTARAISNYTKLITVDKVDLLLFPMPTAVAPSVMNAIDGYGYKPVLLGGSADYKSFLEANLGNQWDTAFEIQNEGHFFNYSTWTWLNSLPAAIKPKKVGFMYGTYSPFTLDSAAGARHFANEIGMDIVYEEGYASGLTDFTPLVSSARHEGTEALLDIATEMSPGKLILDACVAMDWQPKAYWSLHVLYPGYADTNRPGHIQPIAYYTIVPVMHWPTWPDPPFHEAAYWIDEYMKMFNMSAPNFDYGFPIMELQILEQAVSATGSLEMHDLSKYLMEHSFYTNMGRIDFTDKKYIRGLTMATGMIDGDGLGQVIYPQELKTAEGVFPRPPWSTYL